MCGVCRSRSCVGSVRVVEFILAFSCRFTGVFDMRVVIISTA